MNIGDLIRIYYFSESLNEEVDLGTGIIIDMNNPAVGESIITVLDSKGHEEIYSRAIPAIKFEVISKRSNLIHE